MKHRSAKKQYCGMKFETQGNVLPRGAPINWSRDWTSGVSTILSLHNQSSDSRLICYTRIIIYRHYRCSHQYYFKHKRLEQSKTQQTLLALAF